jgi:hypothetical protein
MRVLGKVVLVEVCNQYVASVLHHEAIRRIVEAAEETKPYVLMAQRIPDLGRAQVR